MRSNNLSIASTVLLAVFTAALLASTGFAQQEAILHSFNQYSPTKDGNQVNARVTLDSAGNVYGTTTGGGAYNSGTVYELSPQSDGTWLESRLHDFGIGSDGALPFTPVVLDNAGNLYGTTGSGGAYRNGVLYELTPGKGGVWTEKILFNFNLTPASGLIFDAVGNLYSTGGGGAYNAGTVVEFTRTSAGDWTETILYSFNPNNSNKDGAFPNSGLIFDAAGNLYGTTYVGGGEFGTVFELSPQASGGWTETILHRFKFDGTDGYLPAGDLILDAAGNLYGTTSNGGAHNKGTVFELTPGAGGHWTERIPHSFDPNGKDGYLPVAGLISDAAGNLYGTTVLGGFAWTGAVFELTPAAGGAWSETILHSFRPNGQDGVEPRMGLAIDPAGNLYGTTTDGGRNGGGTAYRVTP